MRYIEFLAKQGPYKVLELADMLNCELVGEGERIVDSISTLQGATDRDIAFYANIKYLADFKSTKAAACIVSKQSIENAPAGVSLLIAKDPYLTYAKLLKILFKGAKNITNKGNIGADCEIASSAYIDESAVIGKDCHIGHNVFIGPGAEIGDGSVIHSNSSLSYCKLGKGCIIYNGANIGQDGFGYAHDGGVPIKVEQVGGVVIGDNVEIGAGTCIDRGAINDTIIGNNTKIDNLVQIGHNVRIGNNCLIVALTGIAGSTTIGNNVVIGGQVGIAGHIKIGNGVMIAAQSGLMKDVNDGAVISGTPAVDIRQWHKQTAILNKLTKSKRSDG